MDSCARETDSSVVRPNRRRYFLLLALGLALVLGGYVAAMAEPWGIAMQHTALAADAPRYSTPTPGERTELRGHVDLQGRPLPPDSSWSIPLQVVFCTSSDGAYWNTWTPTTDMSGDFLIPVLKSGTYDICVKGAHTLRKCKLSVQLVPPITWVDFGTLLEGDANGDNTVNAIDASIMATSYWKADGEAGFAPGADFNEDDYIDARDASLLATNYWKNGDAQCGLGSAALGVSIKKKVSLGPPEPFADILVAPPTTTIAAGDTFSLTVEVDPRGQMINAADVFLQFDPQFLRVVDESGQAAAEVVPISDDLSMVLKNKADNVAGIISYAAMETDPYTPTQNLRLFHVPFRALRQTPPEGTQIQFLFTQSPRRITQLAAEGYDVLSDSYDGSVNVTWGNMLALVQVYNSRVVPGP